MKGIRSPAVSGSFYPADPAELRRLIASYFSDGQEDTGPAIGAVVPHAGLIYSGECAAAVFRRLQIPDLVVILAPNHTGVFSSAHATSIWPSGAFRCPLGDVAIGNDFVSDWRARSNIVDTDPGPHLREHAIEVELPFLAFLAPQTAIVPAVVPWDRWDLCRELGQSLAELVASWSERVLILASSDMNHYESAAVAETKDRAALAHVRQLDGEGLLEACRASNITMCGRAPTATLLHASSRLGATVGQVVDYRHSGMVNGDDTRVVSYAGIVIT